MGVLFWEDYCIYLNVEMLFNALCVFQQLLYILFFCDLHIQRIKFSGYIVCYHLEVALKVILLNGISFKYPLTYINYYFSFNLEPSFTLTLYRSTLKCKFKFFIWPHVISPELPCWFLRFT